MTVLRKPVTRQAMQTDCHNRPWIVTLNPRGLVEIHPKGTREKYALTFGQIYYEAAWRAGEAERQRKRGRFSGQKK